MSSLGWQIGVFCMMVELAHGWSITNGDTPSLKKKSQDHDFAKAVMEEKKLCKGDMSGSENKCER